MTDHRLVEVLPRLAGLKITTETCTDPLGGITPFSLVLDRQPLERLAAGGAPGIDLLIGSNRDEAGLYLAPLVDLAATTEHDVRAVAARFDPDPDRVIRAYRAARPSASAAELRTALLGDAMFGVGTRRYAHASAHAEGGSATFVYEFGWRPDTLHGQLGACHLMDLPFVFDRTDLAQLHGPEGLLGGSPPPPELAARMHAAWVGFAATGHPGWSPYRPDAPTVQEINTTWALRTARNSTAGPHLRPAAVRVRRPSNRLGGLTARPTARGKQGAGRRTSHRPMRVAGTRS